MMLAELFLLWGIISVAAALAVAAVLRGSGRTQLIALHEWRKSDRTTE